MAPRRLLPYPLLALALIGLACSDRGRPLDPEELEIPVWEGDIELLLLRDCATCHTIPPTGGAEPDFRLDKYSASDGPDALPGALEMASRIRARVVLQRSMPPELRLDRATIDRIDRWVRAGAPRTEQ